MSRLVPLGQYIVDAEDFDLETMFDYNKSDDGKGFCNYEGLNSGVPTRTTATLTPTTLRNIEQTFIELQRADRHVSQAGFVPPPITQSNFGVTAGTSGQFPDTLASSTSGGALVGGCSGSGSSATYGTDSSSAGSPAALANTPPPPPKRRNMGGRRPNKLSQNISPEEEERRKVRRERNKMAAARCRKRRLDHTNELIEETAGLERKKKGLEDEIRQLQVAREELELILRTHRACCRLQTAQRSATPPDVKPAFRSILVGEKAPTVSDVFPIQDPEDGVRVKVEILESVDNYINLDNDIIFTSPQANKRIMLSQANLQVVTTSSGEVNTLNTPTPMAKPNRPSFLDVPMTLTPAQAHGLKNNPGSGMEVAGVAITTPSNGIPFNFESIMNGGTGLTPMQPCASEQHKPQPEALTSEISPSKLVIL